MIDNIYIKALEIGHKNLNGISYDDLKIKLNSDLLKDKIFEFHFLIWFYDNFFNENAEKEMVRHRFSSQLKFETDATFLIRCNNQKSFIKGDSLSKYIDYLELKHTRESSTTAKKFSIISIIIASLAIVVPPIISNYFPPSKNVVIPDKRNDTTNSKFHNSDSCKLGSENMINAKSPSTDNLKKVNPKTNSN